MVNQRHKETLIIKRLMGTDEDTDLNELLPEQIRSSSNILFDKRIIKARPGTILYPATAEYYTLKSVYIEGLGRCMVRYCLDGYVEYTQDPTSGWTRLKFTDDSDQEFTFNTYKPQFLEFKGRLWMTNGVDAVQVWDGKSVVKLLEDEVFMRGRYIVDFQNRIFLLNTPECGYNFLYSRFADDDDNDVEPDMEGAWNASSIHSIPQAVKFVGAYALSDRLFLLSKGGIFAMWFEEVPQLLKKISSIHCVEGNYTNTNIPMAFDEEQKGYVFDGRNFNELTLIKNTLKDANNPFRKTNEVFIVTKGDWDKGTHTTTSADLIKNNLTIALNASTYHSIIEVTNTGYPLKVQTSLYLGQSFVVKKDQENNIGYHISRISPYLTNLGGTDATVKLYLLKYTAPPSTMGDAGYEIMGEKEITLTAHASGYTNFDFDEPIKLESNILYYIAVVEISSTGDIDWHSSNTNVYDDGVKYSPKATSTEGDFAFKVYIAQLEADGSYLSPVFHDSNILKGLLFSISINEPDDIAIIADFRSAPSEGELDDAQYDSVTHPYGWRRLTDSLYRLDLTDILTDTLTYFQFKFYFQHNTYFKTQIIYAVRITYLTQEGQINAFNYEGKNYLMLKDCTLMGSKNGWYKYGLKLDHLTDWKNELWATTGNRTKTY